MTELICIVCPKGCHLHVDEQDGYRVTGNSCARGAEYGCKELTNPTRVITSTVKITGAARSRLPVKTDRDIPKPLIFEAMKLLNGVKVQSPVKTGDIIVKDILGTGVNFVATRDM
jgi:Uncharacterized protein with conserved CXXC pairs